jgi:uncharacterized protein DUF1707/cell wall-active antibiotic response 4TMS protein YvqF
VSDGPQHPAILASDAEREGTVELLRQAVADGRLTLEEFSDRVGLAQVARTDQDLAVLGSDLPATPIPAAPPDTAGHRALCSRLVRSGPWEVPPRSAYRCLFGTIELDLAQARLTAPETVIEIFNLFGTVTLIVPEGVRVSMEGGGPFASQVIHSPHAPPVEGAPVLRIKASGPGGTLYVRNQREQPNRWTKLLGTGDPSA